MAINNVNSIYKLIDRKINDFCGLTTLEINEEHIYSQLIENDIDKYNCYKYFINIFDEGKAIIENNYINYVDGLYIRDELLKIENLEEHINNDETIVYEIKKILLFLINRDRDIDYPIIDTYMNFVKKTKENRLNYLKYMLIKSFENIDYRKILMIYNIFDLVKLKNSYVLYLNDIENEMFINELCTLIEKEKIINIEIVKDLLMKGNIVWRQ